MGSKTFNEKAIRARIAYGGYYPAEDAADLTALLARVAELETLSRALLARLSFDYGDAESVPADVAALFADGDRLLPIE